MARKQTPRPEDYTRPPHTCTCLRESLDALVMGREVPKGGHRRGCRYAPETKAIEREGMKRLKLDLSFCRCHSFAIIPDAERPFYFDWYGPDRHHIYCGKSEGNQE